MRFCYIDVANITKISQTTKHINMNRGLFNVKGKGLTFIKALPALFP